MERLPIEKFTRFQTEKVTQVPLPKCRMPLYVNDTCYPRYAEDDCHKCAIEWEANQ